MIEPVNNAPAWTWIQPQDPAPCNETKSVRGTVVRICILGQNTVSLPFSALLRLFGLATFDTRKEVVAKMNQK